MTGLQLTDQVVLPERDVILEEQNQRVGNNPRARLGEQIDAALYLNHPYGKPVIGWRHEMEQLSRDDAIGFYRRFYAPNDAVVVIAGDVEPEAARKLARGNLRQGRSPRQYPAAPASAGAAAGGGALADARRSARRAADRGSRLSGAVVRAPPSPANRKRSRCSRIFWAPAHNSRLYRALVVDKRVAVSAGACYDSYAIDMSKFGVVRRAAPGRHAAAARSRRRRGDRRRDRQGRVGRGTGTRQVRLIADAVYAQDNQVSMARWYGTAVMTGATVDDVRRWPDRITRGHRRAGAGRRPPLARQAALGHRLSDQGR